MRRSDHRCPYRIAPFPKVEGQDVLVLQCELSEAHIGIDPHVTVLNDYAFPGSVTRITWDHQDRRNFQGDWIECPATKGCVLPANHRGRCAQ